MPKSIYKTPEGERDFQAWYDSALNDLDIEFESRTIQTSFGKTHMLVAGDEAAPPLVLVQGYGGSAPLWHKQYADLVRQHRVYALDTVGMPGRSAATPMSLLDASYTRWLVEVFDVLELNQPDVMGVCLGGWIVLRLGIDAPERIRKAVLLSPVGLARFKIYVRSGVPLILNMGDAEKSEKYGQRLLLHAFTPPGSNLQFDRKLAKAMLLAVKHFDVGTAAGLINERPRWQELWTATRVLGRFVRHEPASELREFGVPALLLVGEYEAIYNPQAAVRHATTHMPNVRAEIVPNTGHAAIYDRPDYVNPRILSFLSDGYSSTMKQMQSDEE